MVGLALALVVNLYVNYPSSNKNREERGEADRCPPKHGPHFVMNRASSIYPCNQTKKGRRKRKDKSQNEFTIQASHQKFSQDH